MCLEIQYPGSLANLTQVWGSHSENENTPQKCLHEGYRVKVWKAEVNRPMLFDWIQCVANNFIKNVKNEQKHHKKLNARPQKRLRSTFLVIPCNYSPIATWDVLALVWAAGIFLSKLLRAANCKKTLKYDKRIRALNGSILHHPQPLSVVFSSPDEARMYVQLFWVVKYILKWDWFVSVSWDWIKQKRKSIKPCLFSKHLIEIA